MIPASPSSFKVCLVDLNRESRMMHETFAFGTRQIILTSHNAGHVSLSIGFLVTGRRPLSLETDGFASSACRPSSRQSGFPSDCHSLVLRSLHQLSAGTPSAFRQLVGQFFE